MASETSPLNHTPTVLEWKTLVDAHHVLLQLDELRLADELADILIEIETKLDI